MNTESTPLRQPTILRYTQDHRNGIQAHTYTRNAIGYIVKGKKYIYYGDVGYEISEGDVFFLGPGNYHIEDIPEKNKSFEQIIFYYDSTDFNKILNNLSIAHHMSIEDDHKCPECNKRADVIYPAWPALKTFFNTVYQYFKEDIFVNDGAAESLKSTELVYLILSNKNCCIKSKIIKSGDSPVANFENIIRDHTFKNITIKELAEKCNRSPSSFKKDFVRHFQETPGRWFTKQRLMYSCLLLISTGKPVSEIAGECTFSSVSHFTRAFKKEFGMNPTDYRNKGKNSNKNSKKEYAGT